MTFDAKNIFDYKNGQLFWKVRTTNRMHIGDEAGSFDKGYSVVTFDGRAYRRSHIVWLYHHGKLPTDEVDHINGNTSDDRIENLREATRQQNTCNTRRYKTNKSGYRGVFFNKGCTKNPWEARVSNKVIGYFKTPEDASRAYKKQAKKLHGEFYHDF